MLILDELVTEDQRQMLLQNKIRVRQIGHELGTLGMSDKNIIRLLHQLTFPTFFTRDLGFYTPKLQHPEYCLVILQVNRSEVYQHISKFLQIDKFSTNNKRMGTVVLVSTRNVKYYDSRTSEESELNW